MFHSSSFQNERDSVIFFYSMAIVNSISTESSNNKKTKDFANAFTNQTIVEPQWFSESFLERFFAKVFCKEFLASIFSERFFATVFS